jgi:RNA polymerase sigma-70 factor (ECF subfamily)
MMMSVTPLPAKSLEPPADRDDLADVVAAIGGDEAAFERLVDRHQRPVLALCQRLVGANDAKDLFQETFLRACRGLPQLRAPAAFRTWLFRIAVRGARRRIATRGRTTTRDEFDSLVAPTGGDPLELREDVARLRVELANLPPRQREVVVLRHYHGLDFAQIATLLQIREDAARANHYQGLKRLRRELFEGTSS